MNDPAAINSHSPDYHESARGRLVSPSFKPAAAYLLADSPHPRNAVALVRVDDADVGPILTHPHDSEIGQKISTAKTWSPGEGRFLRHVLRPGMNAIDVGANIGYFSLLMADAVAPHGRVLAIEPDPESFAILRANLALRNLANVEVLPVAATRGAQLVTMSRHAGNLGGHKGFVVSGASDYVTVQGVRLDDVLDPDQPIALVKVDIEGMDHAAVAGLEQTIRRWRPTLLVEFNPVNIEAFGDDPLDVLRLYRALDLVVSVLGPDLLLLRDHAGFNADALIHDNLVLMPPADSDFVDRTRRIGLVNLVLAPGPAPR